MRAEEQSKIREAAAGTIFLLIGTVCFASKSIWIKWAYQMGAEPDAVLLYRQLLAVPLFWLIFLTYRPPMPDGKKKGDLWKACGAGVFCFFLSPLLDFIGLNHVSAMVERILLMSYPLFVFGFAACRDRKMSSIQDLFAVLAVMFGLFLALGGWNAELFQANMIGAVFILLSSAVYAGYLVLSGHLVHQIGGIRLNAYGMTAAGAAMMLYTGIKSAAGMNTPMAAYPLSMYGLFAVIAVVTTVIPFVLMLEGIKRIGAQRAAAISMAGPILTIFYGALFLGERLRLIQVIGYTAVFFVITGMEYRKLKTGKKE
ncbi:DMT family transporter [Bacillus subtilis]|uniref:DMT family transporter n=1 Tax=Bacillus TaxID=1386 RepID=UPI000F63F83D|nr:MULTISPECIES: DMT family transporter [Bacillus]MBA5717026.1 DMT family transporter [Bacillus subtilis]MDK1004955.1 DMT family transporter [Bacillus subtilis]MEC2402654.1 DMT family transporter [Bacillus subtilis]MED4662980.1 DMT family transporter [Bacillus subtilis]MED4666536.1 DMT family transporter [Bacillus subtilis]